VYFLFNFPRVPVNLYRLVGPNLLTFPFSSYTSVDREKEHRVIAVIVKVEGIKFPSLIFFSRLVSSRDVLHNIVVNLYILDRCILFRFSGAINF
jgi:hypothetical protein